MPSDSSDDKPAVRVSFSWLRTRDSQKVALSATRPGPFDPEGALPVLPELAPRVAPEPERALLWPGMRFKTYEVLQSIGRGGMGEVFAAFDHSLRRRVALKVLRSDLSFVDDDREAERLLAEARTAAHLNHVSFVRVYEAAFLPGSRHPYIAMEYLRGQTLRLFMNQPRDPGQILPLFLDLLAGLAFAHKRQIVHRDLKPENVFVTEDGELKILDLGLARLSGPPVSSTIRAAQLPVLNSTAAGTHAYMAPEQWTSSTVGPGSDVWALGVILFEALAGSHPFWNEAATLRENVHRVCAEPPPLAMLNGHLPGELLAPLGRALAKDPSQRFADAAVMHAEFSRCYELCRQTMTSAESVLTPGLALWQLVRSAALSMRARLSGRRSS